MLKFPGYLAVYGETLHQYLLYTSDDYKRPNGQIYHTYPSLKSADDQAALSTLGRSMAATNGYNGAGRFDRGREAHERDHH